MINKRVLVLCLLLSALVHPTFAQGTAFTYQGRLNDGATAANGSYDIAFTLFATNTGGSAVAGPVTNAAVAVSNGLFTTTVDLGNAFPGANRWLELAVSTNGANAFIPLAPRQSITATPYAIQTANAVSAGSVAAANIAGTIPLAQLPATVVTNGASGVSFDGAFTGNGIGLTNLNATTFGGLSASNYWRIGGNADVTTNRYIGTTDYQPLELRVNNSSALRIQPAPQNWPNLVAGASNNYVLDDNTGVGIGGGVGNGVAGTSGGAHIGGGRGNFMATNTAGSVIGGGTGNQLGDGAVRSVISGGWSNLVGGATGPDAGNVARDITDGTSNTILVGETFPGNAFIGGGWANRIGRNAPNGAIVGGRGNAIADGTSNTILFSETEAGGGFIGGGRGNVIQTNSPCDVIVGGGANTLLGDGAVRFIGGGVSNVIDGTSNTILIGGGENRVQASADYAFLGGGWRNTNAGAYSVIGGGANNLTTGSHATISGGLSNTATQQAFAAGTQARAIHTGTFVWADSQGGDFASTGAKQFLIRASGGVAIGTNDPAGAALRVVGSVRADSFSGNGAGLTNLNASTISGGAISASALSNAWLLGGNSGTSLAILGTTGNQPLQLKVNNTSALRLEYPTAGSVPNLIGGFTSNSVGGGAEGVVIAGGGAFGNINSIGADSDYSVIGGGQANTIASSVFYATIAGGGRTSISTNCFASTIGGGFDNNISSDSPYATIAGGEFNVIRANSRGSTVSGGINHFVLDNSECATIAGGKLNDIRTDSDFSTVSGGFDNNIGTNASFSVILGGDRNGIGNNAQAALAAGRLANANHTGTFVWADSQIATFASTGTNQFLIRASGGVGIGTGSPEGDLHVRGNSSTGSFILTPNVSDSRSQILLSENTTASFGMILRYEGDRSNNPLHFIGLSSDVESSPILTIERSGANVGIGVTNPVSKLQVNGTVTATAFNPSSDRNLKENFHAMDPRQVLEKVVALPISRWNFIGDPATPHVGPMAQDFHAAFGLGTDDKHIATVDADGVALAAIQGLNQKLEERLEQKESEIAKLMARMARMEQVIAHQLNGGVK